MNKSVISNLGFTLQNGLCESISDAKNNTERLYLDEALKLGVSAVFFRRYYKNKEKQESPFHSEPAVSIFKRTESFFNSQEHKSLHAALWSESKVEVYIILSPTRIDINTFKVLEPNSILHHFWISTKLEANCQLPTS